MIRLLWDRIVFCFPIINIKENLRCKRKIIEDINENTSNFHLLTTSVSSFPHHRKTLKPQSVFKFFARDINVSNFTSYFLPKYKFGTVKKLQNQNILFNERNIIKHSFSLLALLLFFNVCRHQVLYSCCLNVLSPKKSS